MVAKTERARAQGMFAVVAGLGIAVLSLVAVGTFMLSVPTIPSSVTSSTAGAPIIQTATSCTDDQTLARRDRAVRWIEGLAVKLILPSDVSGRLSQQDPALGQSVAAAWSELDGIRDRPARLQSAVRWLNGLSLQGMLIPSDVPGRLRSQDPELASVVSATWSRLRCPG